ncbi:hypothetical protein EIM50_16730 [Pseudoxanthomonas sp. SGD-10]|nr:hypothetical protein EIM50_16730 [Pseudoxanthomonas sp. SGD-10]
MKKLQVRFGLLSLAALLAFGLLLTACSKDSADETSKSGKIDDAVGTYKGTMFRYGSATELFDVILIVTKEGDNKLKITPKSGEVYSDVTPRVFTVEVGDFFGEHPVDVISLSGSVGGYFSYYGESKSVSILSTKLQESDVTYTFEGVKQE